MKHLTDEVRHTNTIEETFEKMNQMEEEIPSSINEESEIIGEDLQVLQMTILLLPKEKGCLFDPFHHGNKTKRQGKPYAPKEPRNRTEYATQRPRAPGATNEENRFFSKHREDAYEEEMTMEMLEEAAEWDREVEGAGRFDEKGNFVLDEPEKEESSSTSEDWITVKSSKEKKKRQGKEDVTEEYTAIPVPVQAQAPVETKAAHEAQSQKKKEETEEDTDSEGFTVVKEKKNKASRRFKK